MISDLHVFVWNASKLKVLTSFLHILWGILVLTDHVESNQDLVLYIIELGAQWTIEAVLVST